MESLYSSIGYLWLAAGIVFLCLEALAAPGVGLAFAGVGALLTGIAVETGSIGGGAIAHQCTFWLVTTGVLAVLLWRPLRRWRTAPAKGGEYHNIVGDLATVIEGDLVRGQIGRARWSGTLMQAEIDPMADTVRIAENEPAEITRVEGNILYLRPRGSRRQEEVL